MRYALLVAIALMACTPKTTYTAECDKRGEWRPIETFGAKGCIGKGFHAAQADTPARCAELAARWRAAGQLTVEACSRSRVVVREW